MKEYPGTYSLYLESKKEEEATAAEPAPTDPKKIEEAKKDAEKKVEESKTMKEVIEEGKKVADKVTKKQEEVEKEKTGESIKEVTEPKPAKAPKAEDVPPVQETIAPPTIEWAKGTNKEKETPASKALENKADSEKEKEAVTEARTKYIKNTQDEEWVHAMPDDMVNRKRPEPLDYANTQTGEDMQTEFDQFYEENDI